MGADAVNGGNGNDNRHVVKPKKDLTGMVFGALRVLGLSDRLGSRGKRLVPLWECECECGEITYKATDTLTNKDRNSCADCAKDYIAGEMRKGAGYMDGTQISKIHGRPKESGNLSGVRGVYFDGGRYRARLKFKGKLYNLGSFENLEDAVKAREEGEREIYGAFLETVQGEGQKRDRLPLDEQIQNAQSMCSTVACVSEKENIER